MYTGALIICALLAVFGFAAVALEKVLDRLVFEPMEEDWDALGEE